MTNRDDVVANALLRARLAMIPAMPWETGPLAAILGTSSMVPFPRPSPPLDVASWIGVATSAG